MWHAMGVVSKTDENGNFIVEVCGQPNMKMAPHFLEWQRPEKWGKRRKGTSSTELYMDLHFVGTANVFVYYPYLKKARSAPARYVHGNAARQVDGIFIVQLNCFHTSMPLSLKTSSASVGRRSSAVTAEFLSATVRTRVGSTTC